VIHIRKVFLPHDQTTFDLPSWIDGPFLAATFSLPLTEQKSSLFPPSTLPCPPFIPKFWNRLFSSRAQLLAMVSYKIMPCCSKNDTRHPPAKMRVDLPEKNISLVQRHSSQAGSYRPPSSLAFPERIPFFSLPTNQSFAHPSPFPPWSP